MSINQAYRICEAYARSHYENFPVVSIFLPNKLKPHIAAIYCFARMADDIADHPTMQASEKIVALDKLTHTLKNLSNSDDDNPIIIALTHTIQKYNLDVNLFCDLLHAFKIDIKPPVYNTFEEVLDYCKYSANPVGHILLQLTGNDTDENIILSNKICSSLQLLNFLQDLVFDWEKLQRCYLPLQDLQQCGLTVEHIGDETLNHRWQKVILLQLDRILVLLNEGKSLGNKLAGRFGINIKVIIRCAYLIHSKLHANALQDKVFHRPVVRKHEIIWLLLKVLMVRDYA